MFSQEINAKELEWYTVNEAGELLPMASTCTRCG